MRKDLLNLTDIKNAIMNIKGQNINIEVNRGRKKMTKKGYCISCNSPFYQKD